MAKPMTVALLGSAVALAAGESGSPMAKILQMMSDMQQKIIKEGEAAQAAYSEFAEWCEDRSRDIAFAQKNGKSTIESLKATIEEKAALINARNARIEELAGSLSSDDADLKAATQVREKEAKTFSVEEQDLVSSVSMLKRASSIIEKEMKGGASMLQLKNADSLVKALDVMVRASLIETSDAAKLTSMLQQGSSADSDAEDGDESVGAPAPDAYESQSGAVLETLEDLLDKAEGQLDELRTKETNSLNNYQLLKQSLEDQIKVANKEMDTAKKDIAAAGEAKSAAEGDLDVTVKDVKEGATSKADLHHDCMNRAEDFEAETKSRGEELEAIAAAKKALQEVSGDASFSQLSFVQMKRSMVSSSNFQAVRTVRSLARKFGSTELAMLATKIASEMHAGGPFDKVKAMISDMIAKLEDSADADAKKKAYCDKELAETTAKKEDKSDDLESMTTKIESATARSGQLKEELAVIQKETSALIKSQAEMDKLRAEEKATYKATKAELETALGGVQKALKILNDYYGGGSSGHSTNGASSGVIALLETVESDLSKNLAEITSEEETSAANYKSVTQENEVSRASMEQDVKYKTRESKELDKTASELKGDRGTTQEEFDAVNEYFARIQSDCSGKVESYEETVKRRAAEIEGLKQALDALDSESLVQTRSSHHTRRSSALRGHVLTPAV